MEGAGDDIPDGWTAKVSRSSGQAYYVNRFTNESQWEKPTKPAQKPSSEKVQVKKLKFTVIKQLIFVFIFNLFKNIFIFLYKIYIIFKILFY